MTENPNLRNIIFLIILVTIVSISFFTGFTLGNTPHQRLIDKVPEIIFSENIKQDLKQFYKETENNEYSICLEGYQENQTIYITGYQHFTIGNTTNVYHNNFCEGFMGHLHKHPDGVYLTSLSDASFYYYGFSQGLRIVMIQYQEDKISVKSRTNWYEGKSIKI